MGSTGTLTGYSGGNGLPTKKKLLELEGIQYR
jgi:O6-methylguanine-DNA--protein-cysteine methyltransferase